MGIMKTGMFNDYDYGFANRAESKAAERVEQPGSVPFWAGDLLGYPVDAPDPEAMKAYCKRMLDSGAMTKLAYTVRTAEIDAWWSVWGSEWSRSIYRG